MKHHQLLYALLLLATGLRAGATFERELSGEVLQIGTMLVWSTGEEDNLGRFVIERGSDRTTFKQAGSVEAHGDTDRVHEYHFLDLLSGTEQPYYRLRMVDLDGTVSYSSVFELADGTPNEFVVAKLGASVVSDTYALTVDALRAGLLEYRLVDWFGNDLLHASVDLTPGLNELTIDVSTQPEGIYTIVLRRGDETETIAFKKMLREAGGRPNVAAKPNGTIRN